jgi:SAM-dependent methyltransferase
MPTLRHDELHLKNQADIKLSVMKESDIRPADVFSEYLRLSALDAESYFSSGDRQPVSCVACGSASSRPAFRKNGFDYVECQVCRTLYLSPRPRLSEFEKFYNDSPSSEFWAKKFFPALMGIRRELIFVPRAQRIHGICKERGIRAGTVVDVGAGHGIFLEEWRNLEPQSRVCAIEPGRELANVCRGKGIEVLEVLAEQAQEWEGRADLLICFEVIEHAHDPLAFVRSLCKLVKPGGAAIVSGLGVDGYDIQVLWEHSKSVSPPHHINFMSVQGYETLFRRAGFSQVEVTTPGKLDVDIVRNTLTQDPALLEGRHFEKTLLSRGPEALSEFQAFLAKHRMSSHVWTIASRSS